MQKFLKGKGPAEKCSINNMNILESIKNSWHMIIRNKMRSFLTMLGIIIGITAVMIVLSVGESVQGLILNEVKSIGSNLVGVLPGYSDENSPPSSTFGVVITSLKYDDGEAILKGNNSHIESLAMYVSGSDIITIEDNKVSATFYGTTASYPDVQNSSIEEGRFFTKEEEIGNARVVVLGNQIAKDLFGDQNPIGMKMKIKKSSFTVIGIFKKKGGSLIQNEDGNLFVPISTAQALETISVITDALRFFLAAIAAISLVVGGFGIMNIMLATVQERTKEIGLRKAIGAKNADITRQFLIEAMAITFISGLIGIVVGSLFLILISVIINAMNYHWDLIISPLSIILGCIVSIGIGLIFGIAPARKASLLNPIEALRYE